MEQRKMINNDEFSFSYLKIMLNKNDLPLKNWGYTTGWEDCVALQKVEMDMRVRKRVAVLSNLHVEIYIDDKIVPFSELIILVNMQHFIDLLKKVDEIPLSNL